MWQGFQAYVPAAFTPQGIPCLLISVRGWIDPQGHSAASKNKLIKNANDLIENLTRDLPACNVQTQENFTFAQKFNISISCFL